MRKVLEHRGHKVIASDLNGAIRGQAYFGKVPIIEGRFEAKSFDEIFAQAKSWIDARLAKFSAAQRSPNIALPKRYQDFLMGVGLQSHEKSMLVEHAKRRVITATQLAAAAGWGSYSPANIHYGYLGQQVCKNLDLTVPKRDDGTSIWKMALAEPTEDKLPDDGEHFQWAIHPELVQGMLLSGILDEEPSWLLKV